MVAGLGKVVARGRTSRAPALIAPRDARFDPSLPLKLQKLLSHRLARELQRSRELSDRGWALTLERKQDGAAAVRKLVYGNDGVAPQVSASMHGTGLETLESNRWIVKDFLANQSS